MDEKKSESIYPRSSKRRGSLRSLFVGIAVALVASAIGVAIDRSMRAPLLPPLSSETTTMRDRPSVILAIRDLQRLESAEMHIERVMDMKNEESHLFGLVHAEDALLLVAAGDVVAGIDLGDLKEGDVDADRKSGRVKIALPAPKILSSKLDNDKTYVYSRNVDLLARRKETLESDARSAAEKELIRAATDGGILDRASKNAIRSIDGIVRALGYEQIEITIKPAT